MARKKFGSKFKQGQYKPINAEKYKGKYPIIYRSSWELQLMKFLDKNPSVIEWGSESFVVKYRDPTRNNSIHRYFTDFTSVCKTPNGTKKYIIEVKPYAETIPPKRGRKKESTYKSQCITYARNQAKWKYAVAACKKRGWEFLIITERELFKNNKK